LGVGHRWGVDGCLFDSMATSIKPRERHQGESTRAFVVVVVESTTNKGGVRIVQIHSGVKRRVCFT